MLGKIASSTGRSRLQMMFTALILVVLFVGGFQLSALLSRPTTSQPADTAVGTGSLSLGGVGTVNPPKQLHDFTLTSQTGDPISLSDLRGRAVVLFFGYTHCPDECPTTMANFKRVKQMLGDQADQVAFVFVSVDGKRDTPAQLASFIDKFDASFVGMTGSEAVLREIGSEYGLVFSEGELTAPPASDDQVDGEDQALDQENYFVQHTSPSFLIDRNGFLRQIAFYGTQPAVLADHVRQLLEETHS